jgi:hypothetical protein
MHHKDTVLAGTAQVVGSWIHKSLSFPDHYQFGSMLSIWVSVDAFVVLAGAVLTSYVGINGLIRRMSMDRCLPQIFLKKNKFTGTDSFILVGFFVLCVSQVIIMDSDVEALGGVYCYAFLSVMTIFAFGNMLLKVKRPSLPREISASWPQSVAGLVAVVIALLGNILGKPELLTYFFVYFLIIGTLVLVMFQRVAIMRLLYKVVKNGEKTKKKHARALSQSSPLIEEGRVEAGGDYEADTEAESVDVSMDMEGGMEGGMEEPRSKTSSFLTRLSANLKMVQDVPFVFFCKHDDLHMLNKAVLYLMNNEQTSRLIVVHCSNGVDTNCTELSAHVKLVDLLYPKTKISLLIIEDAFGPNTVEWLSQQLDVPVNAMFISCPDKNFAMKVSQLRGMRIITSF